MSTKRQRVHTYWSLFTFSHGRTKAWGEFQTKTCVNVHTLVKCMCGREAQKDEDMRGMNIKHLVSLP